MAVPCELIGGCKSPPTLAETIISFISNPFFIFAVILFFIILLVLLAKKRPEGRLRKFLDSALRWLRENTPITTLTVGLILVLLPVIMPNEDMLVASVQNEFSYWTAVSASKFMGLRFGLIICLGIILSTISIYNIFKRKK